MNALPLSHSFDCTGWLAVPGGMSAPAGAAGGRPGVSAPKDDDVPLLNNQAYEVCLPRSHLPIHN